MSARVNRDDLMRSLTSKEAPAFDPFLDTDYVLLAFRRVNEQHDGVREHYLNRWAVAWTRRRSDKPPGGQFCHVELCVAFQRNLWCRVSINKKTASHHEKTGRVQWHPGSVHCKPVDGRTLTKYTLLRLPVPREKQYLLSRFVETQLGSPFNYWGYACNTLFGTSFGSDAFGPEMLERRCKFFCSELVCCALQLMEIPEVKGMTACKQNPNSLFRELRSAGAGQYDFNPALAEDLTV